MKKTYFLIILSIIVIIAACGNNKNNKETSKISKIDTSINATNAYNNFFLDSTQLENFIDSGKIDTQVADKMRNFYYSRNFEYAWLAADGLTEQARGFWMLHNYHTAYNDHDTSMNDKKLAATMKALSDEDSTALQPTNKKTITTELLLTKHFIVYLQTNYEVGIFKHRGLESFVPAKKIATLEAAKTFMATDETDYEKANNQYRLLKEQLRKYYAITTNGGWDSIAIAQQKFKTGDSLPIIISIKKRLQKEGLLQPTDTSFIFDDALATSIKNYQTNNGYTPTGIIDNTLLKDLNVTATKRLQQLLINMNRMRWLPDETNDKLIVANIPEFKLHVYENNKEAFEMKIVVGKEGHSTVMFFGKLSEVVFSPYWNIPPSIVRREILPSIAKNSNYLHQKNMEKTGESNGLPIIRQKPGGKNALGKVKFLFPNVFNIYFHDTPEKSLFDKDNRAASHGCIRLAEPFKMAVYVLKDKPEWTNEKITEAMNKGVEKSVDVKKPIPVIVTYYTAWIGYNEQLNFRNDIYAHDAEAAVKLFTDPL